MVALLSLRGNRVAIIEGVSVVVSSCYNSKKPCTYHPRLNLNFAVSSYQTAKYLPNISFM